jgi:hypothetical protein
MSGMERSCRSSGGFATERVECSGRVASLGGSVGLAVIPGDEDLDGEYLLETTLEVGSGTVRAEVADAEGEGASGEVSPGQPLELSALVQPDDEDVEVRLEVVGEERAEDLTFEAVLTRQN